MNSFFQERVHRKQSRLTRSQMALARYILRNGREVPFLSSAKLAGRVNVSDATVTRFCTALGYSGFSDLQQDLQKWLQMRLTPSERLEKTQPKKSGTSHFEIFQKDIQNLRETSAELRPDQVRGAIRLLSRARKIFVVGMRSSFGLATLAHAHLSGIRDGVVLVESSRGMLPDLLTDIGPRDAMLAVSFPRYTRATLEVAGYGKKRGCRVIAITDSLLSPLGRISNVVLQARIEGVGFINSYTSAVAILNWLSTGLSMANPNLSVRTLKRIETELDKWRIWEVPGS